MSVSELERALARWRDPDARAGAFGGRRLTIQAALDRRDSGNVPDAAGRSLRLVLVVERPGEPGLVERKRLSYEPDYHEAPRWRREGSAPINVVPLPAEGVRVAAPGSWLEDPELEALESEWTETGAVSGLRIPGELRGFVYKTILALRAARVEVTPETVAASISRWLARDDASRLLEALLEANPRA